MISVNNCRSIFLITLDIINGIKRALVDYGAYLTRFVGNLVPLRNRVRLLQSIISNQILIKQIVCPNGIIIRPPAIVVAKIAMEISQEQVCCAKEEKLKSDMDGFKNKLFAAENSAAIL